ncbi:MAG: hypothetical protein AVDCRST_MAG41-1311 [uncultured Corynebacteriales bacterium]|uniref:Uncharacterized protein n=1 Tax=uncultured Mycobacteriales bacterium TaxID=581187 RepID=A0A6J4I0A6_9ACTN|nr:MAG: hypothetical protein AVDCRST_MAG41-1311 [uncultured Corynebacteriales bacterium]
MKRLDGPGSAPVGAVELHESPPVGRGGRGVGVSAPVRAVEAHGDHLPVRRVDEGRRGQPQWVP